MREDGYDRHGGNGVNTTQERLGTGGAVSLAEAPYSMADTKLSAACHSSTELSPCRDLPLPFFSRSHGRQNPIGLCRRAPMPS